MPSICELAMASDLNRNRAIRRQRRGARFAQLSYRPLGLGDLAGKCAVQCDRVGFEPVRYVPAVVAEAMISARYAGGDSGFPPGSLPVRHETSFHWLDLGSAQPYDPNLG